MRGPRRPSSGSSGSSSGPGSRSARAPELLALRELYARIDRELEGWGCDASTDCCRFGVTGREPYPTAVEVAELERAIRAGTVRRYHGIDWLGDAEKAGVLTKEETALLREVETLTARVIAVDHFDPAELKPNYMKPGHNAAAIQRSAAAE